MKRTRSKWNRKSSISNILLLGLMVVVISLVICAIHVFDVEKCFQNITQGNIRADMNYLSSLISGKVSAERNAMEKIGNLVEESAIPESDEKISAFVTQHNELGLFEQFFYVKADGTVFAPDGQTSTMDRTLFNDYFETDEFVVRVDKNRARNNEEGIMYFLDPIYKDGKKVGFILALNSFKATLKGEGIDALRQNGDLFLISQDGMIFAQNATRLKELSSAESANNPNLFTRVEQECFDQSFKRGVESLKTSIKGKKTSFSVIYADKNNYKQCLEIQKISEVEGLCLVYAYAEENYLQSVNSVMQKTLLSSSLIVIITLGMLVYMWATSKGANEMIASLAYDDEVTGGKNDKYFREWADGIVFKENYNIPYLLVRFDIVNFRYINEAYGHTRADQLLKLVYEEATIIFTDKELCGRMSADQFLLLARNDNEFDTRFADLNQAVNEKAREFGIKFPIRFKSGIYAIRNEDSEISVAIDRANAARKTLTGDEKVTTVLYSDKIITQMFKDDKIESEMEAAITNNEFKVFIQPKWNIMKDRLYGGEALVRWIKPDGSRVFPDEFIPVFERNGFVEKLDLYMLEEVCKYLRMLIDTNQRIFPISVNQSRILVHNPEYVNTVTKILKQYRIPPGFIELEITETVFQEQREVMISTVSSLKELDVHVSMDDFGSGYSSLNMLKDVPFDVIKIDREFFSESITSSSSILILQKIVEMAEGLGIRVLCEGVESQEQVDLLKRLGVSFVQGYFYSKPISADEFVKTYCRRKKDGKLYYDNLYEKAVEEHKKKAQQKEEEEIHLHDASGAVLMFKQNYKPKENTNPGSPEQDTAGGRNLEQKKTNQKKPDQKEPDQKNLNQKKLDSKDLDQGSSSKDKK